MIIKVPSSPSYSMIVNVNTESVRLAVSCPVCPFAIVTLFCSILPIQLANALPLFHLYLTGSVSCRSSAFFLYEDSCEQ